LQTTVADNVKLVERAYAVDAVLLWDDSKGSITERTKRVQLDKKQTEQLKKLLQANESYGSAWTSCEPVFAARLVLHLVPHNVDISKGQSKTLTLDLCFHCGQVSAIQDKKWLGTEHFQPMRGELLKLFRGLFPKDAEIATIK